MPELKIKILGDAKALNAAIDKAKNSFATFAKFSSGVLAGVGIAVGGLVKGFTTLKQYVDPVVGKLDDIGKAARRIGISAEEFQELGFAARRTGVDTSVVEKAFKRLQKTIGDSGRGLSTAKDALAALGLSFEQLDGKMPMDQFRIVASSLASIEDVTKRNAIAQDVFGARAGLAVAPLISEYDKLAMKLRLINGVMGEDAVAAAEKYKDELENLQVVLDSLIASTGIIGKMADNFERLEATLTGLRRGTGALKELAAAMGTGVLSDALSGNLNLISLVKGGAAGLGTVGGQEQAARILVTGLQGIFKPKGGATKAGNASVGQLLSSGILGGGGGTFESLGGDVSGGGFAARTSIAQEQLTTLKEIKELTREMVGRSTVMTDEGRIAYNRSKSSSIIKE